MNKTRARDRGMTTIGNGNSTAFAPEIHPEAEAVLERDDRHFLDDAEACRYAVLADSDEDFALLLRTLDRDDMDPTVRLEVARTSFLNANSSERIRDEILRQRETLGKLDDLVLSDRDSTVSQLQKVANRMPGMFDGTGDSQRAADTLVDHPSNTDGLKVALAAGRNHHIHLALATSVKSSEVILKHLYSNLRIGLVTRAAIKANPNLSRKSAARMKVRSLLRRSPVAVRYF